MIISEDSNEFNYYDEDSDEITEEYLETEECLNEETGEIEVKRIKKTRKVNKKNEGNRTDEDGKAKKTRRKIRDSNEAIYNPQLVNN